MTKLTSYFMNWFPTKMNKIYLFDIDGTLTPPRQQMLPTFANFFRRWAENNTFYLVTGSDFAKVQEQVPQDILDMSEGIFCCMGNELLEDGGSKLVYRNSFEAPGELIEALHSFLDSSQYSFPWRQEPHIESRVGMINFSICGRGCKDAGRKRYAAYDGATGERERIRDILINRFPEIDVAIGGQISVDIFPRGNDKSQSVRYLLQQSPHKIIFIGDRCEEGGNDYAARQAIEQHGCGVHFNVGSWVETRAILNSSALYTNKDGIKS